MIVENSEGRRSSAATLHNTIMCSLDGLEEAYIVISDAVAFDVDHDEETATSAVVVAENGAGDMIDLDPKIIDALSLAFLDFAVEDSGDGVLSVRGDATAMTTFRRVDDADPTMIGLNLHCHAGWIANNPDGIAKLDENAMTDNAIAAIMRNPGEAMIDPIRVEMNLTGDSFYDPAAPQTIVLSRSKSFMISFADRHMLGHEAIGDNEINAISDMILELYEATDAGGDRHSVLVVSDIVPCEMTGQPTRTLRSAGVVSPNRMPLIDAAQAAWAPEEQTACDRVTISAARLRVMSTARLMAN